MSDSGRTGSQRPATTAKEVVAFWFGRHADDAVVAEQQSSLWWGKQAEQDRQVIARFGSLREAATGLALEDWAASARGRLALIILVDQFSRMLFRNDARAFSYDTLARRWCVEGLALGHDIALRPIERVFFYLPLEHSESRADQARSVELYSALAQTVPQAQRTLFQGYVEYAHRHQDVILQFRRFPHRNAALKRASTPEELAFLERPGSSF